MKICEQCNREFVPSSRHRKCPSCRHAGKKVLCSCGGTKNPKYNNCSNCVDRKAENSPTWKGGKIMHKAGYIMVRITDHPRSKGNGGYVFEHILVMENHLQRHLVPGENVHHINGVRDDNRLENLELWAKPQPSGVRAKDLLHWAKQIVELYEPVQDKL